MNSTYTLPINLGNPDEHTVEDFAKHIKHLVGEQMFMLFYVCLGERGVLTCAASLLYLPVAIAGAPESEGALYPEILYLSFPSHAFY